MSLLKKGIAVCVGIILILILIPTAHQGVFTTHDGVAHIARIAAYIRAFHDGNVPVRWAGFLNYSYGSPVLNFYYPLPYALGSFLYLFIHNLELIYKLLLFFSFICAPVTFYLWIKKYVSKELSLTISVMYGFSLYHIANLFVRGDIGELMSIVFVPLVFRSIDSLSKKFSSNSVISGSIFYALCLLSHNGIALFFTPIFMGYIISGKSLKLFIQNISMVIIGLCLSAYFWVPAIYERKYTNITLFTGDIYKNSFLTFNRIIMAPWGFGPEVNANGGIAPQLGIIPILMLCCVGIYLLVKHRLKSKNIFWIFILIMSIFMMTSASTILWEHIALLRLIQFPWRLMSVANFALFAAITFGISQIQLSDSHRKIICGACVLVTCISTIPFIRINGYVHHPDSYYFSFPDTTYYHGEATTIWSTGDFSSYPDHPVFVSDGDAQITNYFKKTNLHTYTVHAKTDSKIVENTLYWPGWKVWVDGKKTPIEFQNQNHRGLITFDIPSGDHSIVVRFTETSVRIISNFISGIMICSILVYLLLRKFL